MQLVDVIRSVRRHWRVSIAMLLLTGAALGAFLMTQSAVTGPQSWEASVEVLIPIRDDEGAVPEGLPPELLQGQETIATSGQVTRKAIQNAGLEDDDDVDFAATVNEEGDILTLTATASDRDLSESLANAYTNAFIEQRRATVAATAESGRTGSLSSLQALTARLQQVESDLRSVDPALLAVTAAPDGSDDPDAPPVLDLAPDTPLETVLLVVERNNLLARIRATQQAYANASTEALVPSGFAAVVERTTPSDVSSDPLNPIIPIGIAVIVGLLLAGGVPVLLDRLDHSIRDERAASAALGAPVISRIPSVGRRATATVASVGSARESAYQALAATAIATDQLPRAIVVTAPTGEIQDSVAANFAVALAGLGLQVALVGTDARQAWFVEDAPTSPALNLPDLLTLAHSGRLNGPVRESLVPTHLANLKVVAPADAAPDLLLDGLPALLQSLADGGVDVTVLAGPAFLEDPSATILAWSTRSVLWAIETGSVTTDEAHDAASRLTLAGGTPFGVALIDGRD